MVAALAVVALTGALAGSAPAAASEHAASTDALRSPATTIAARDRGSCRQSVHRYRYRIQVDGSLEHTVTYRRPDRDQFGSAGSWGFRQTYTAEVPEATVRTDLLRGNCGGRLGVVRFRYPGSDPWFLGGTTMGFSYHSDVVPLYPQGHPLAEQPPPPPCSYSLAPSILATRVAGSPLLASWTRGGQGFVFSSFLEPSAEASLDTWIYDTHVERCDEFHRGSNPSSADLDSALVNGIRFHPPTGAGNATVLLEMRRRSLRRLESPVNRLAVGRSFTLDSGTQRKTVERGPEQTDTSAWRTKVRFTRVRR